MKSPIEQDSEESSAASYSKLAAARPSITRFAKDGRVEPNPFDDGFSLSPNSTSSKNQIDSKSNSKSSIRFLNVKSSYSRGLNTGTRSPLQDSHSFEGRDGQFEENEEEIDINQETANDVSRSNSQRSAGNEL